MEDQQVEMIRLRETGALVKDKPTHVQTRLLKQVDTLRKSQSSPTAEERARLPRHHSMTGNPRNPLAT